MKDYVKREEGRFNDMRERSGMMTIAKGCLIYLAPILLIHSVFWIAFQVYSTVCVPSGIFGYFKSILYHGSFVCKAMYSGVDFASGGVYSMITHLVSGLATSQWLCYTGKKT